MKKQQLRKKYKEIRSKINDKEYQNNMIFKKIICETHINNADCILIYVSLNDEVDTFKIINYFLGKKKIAVPKIINNNMIFYYIETINDLEKGYFDILEPISNNKVIDFTNSVCIVPGICFDKNNNRIGYGKGFYDRFLSNLDIYTIGISYNECLITNILSENTDIKMNKVITPNSDIVLK